MLGEWEEIVSLFLSVATTQQPGKERLAEAQAAAQELKPPATVEAVQPVACPTIQGPGKALASPEHGK